MRTAEIIMHVPLEGPGTLGEALVHAGFEIRTLDVTADDLAGFDPVQPDFPVAMGGTIGVHERNAHPLLRAEIRLLRERLAVRLPAIGTCRGAQLMAAAPGADVFPGANGKEIGWSTLEKAAARFWQQWLTEVFRAE